MCVSSVSVPELCRRAKSSQEPCLAFDTYRGSNWDKPGKARLCLALGVFSYKILSVGGVDILEIQPKALPGDPRLGSPSLPLPYLPSALPCKSSLLEMDSLTSSLICLPTSP